MGLFFSAIAFVGTHFLLSHPLREPVVGWVGERAFRAIYSLVAIAFFAAMIWFYRVIGDEPQLWAPGEAAWIAGEVLMWPAAILVVGSFVGNPALPGAPGRTGGPKGVFTITRHPMMWGVALWAMVHLMIVATPKALVLDGAILLLAGVGAALQDRKKAGLMGEAWHKWTAQTAFWPFARGLANPGAFALILGTLLFIGATWLHPVPVGVWRWFG